MTLHLLDFVMYFVVVGIYWFILDKVSNGELTNELGGLVGMIGALVITIIYVILFAFMGWDWSDIFSGTYPESWLKLRW